MRPAPRFVIRPDPPVAGQPAVVEYKGQSTSVEWKVDDGPPRKCTVPPAVLEILSVPAGGTIWVNDGTGDPEGVDVWAIDNP